MAFLCVNLISQEEEQWYDNFSISGSVDGYFRHNLGAPNKLDTTEDSFIAPATSFANESGFALGMANMIFGYEGDKVGFVGDLVFGPRGKDAVFGSNDSASIVNQLFVYWNVSEKMKLTFGNFQYVFRI